MAAVRPITIAGRPSKDQASRGRSLEEAVFRPKQHSDPFARQRAVAQHVQHAAKTATTVEAAIPVCLDRPRQSLTSRALAGRGTPEAGGSGLASPGSPVGGTLRLLLPLLLNAAAGVVAGALALALVTGARRLMAWSAVTGWFEGVSVDTRPVEVPEGATVVDAVDRLEITLPQLCKDPDRAPSSTPGGSSTTGTVGRSPARIGLVPVAARRLRRFGVLLLNQCPHAPACLVR